MEVHSIHPGEYSKKSINSREFSSPKYAQTLSLIKRSYGLYEMRQACTEHATVCVISYSRCNNLVSAQVEECHTLNLLAQRLSVPIGGGTPELTLFIVQDVPQEIVELLGSKFDVDPFFFQEHIQTPTWPDHQFRREQLSSSLASKSSNWFQMKFIKSRYFEDDSSFRDGEGEVSCFNVSRRLVGNSSRQFWDREQSRVGLMGSKATFWMKCAEIPGASTTGIYAYSMRILWSPVY